MVISCTIHASLILCSAGVGRTGTFINIDCVMEQVEKQGMVNIPLVIQKIRKQRATMVQTVVRKV